MPVLCYIAGMLDKKNFDFWYAVNNTEVLKLPDNKLETFGTSVVNYHLLCELMDSVDKVRVREGRIEAYRPQILTPQSFADTMLDGFGDEASKYTEWLRSNESDLMILKYGFAIRKQETNDHIVSENLPVMIDRMKDRLHERNDPLSALLVGVEEPWEVCLVKLMVEVVQQSAPEHVRMLKQDPIGARHEIEKAFQQAAQDKSMISELSAKLHRYKLFEEYEDRFFTLVRSMH